MPDGNLNLEQVMKRARNDKNKSKHKRYLNILVSLNVTISIISLIVNGFNTNKMIDIVILTIKVRPEYMLSTRSLL